MRITWPWSKAEKREAPNDYTDLLLQAALGQATGAAFGDPSALGRLRRRRACGARAFASARVEDAPTTVQDAIKPSMLALLGRELIRRGEALFIIEIDGGAIRLEPSGYWDTRGRSTNPRDWFFRADRFAPDHTTTDLLPAAQCLLFTFDREPYQPWRGRSPLESARSLANLAATGELRLGEELRMPVGGVLPWPTDPGEPDEDGNDDVTALRTALAKLRGTIGVVETTAGGHGLGKESAPKRDWKIERVGPETPDSIIDLHTKAAHAVLAACGVPPSLAAVGGDAAGAREAFRQFVFASVMSEAKKVQEVLREGLDAPRLRLDFRDVAASDLQGRARSAAALVKAGWSKDEAGRIAGI